MNKLSPTELFYRDLLVCSVIASAAIWAVARFILQMYVPLSFWLCLLFLIVLFAVIFQLLVKANNKRPQAFVTTFLGSLTGKLFLSAILILIVGLLDRSNLNFTAIAFFCTYALFSFFEIKNLLPLMRNTKD